MNLTINPIKMYSMNRKIAFRGSEGYDDYNFENNKIKIKDSRNSVKGYAGASIVGFGLGVLMMGAAAGHDNKRQTANQDEFIGKVEKVINRALPNPVLGQRV